MISRDILDRVSLHRGIKKLEMESADIMPVPVHNFASALADVSSAYLDHVAAVTQFRNGSPPRNTLCVLHVIPIRWLHGDRRTRILGIPRVVQAEAASRALAHFRTSFAGGGGSGRGREKSNPWFATRRREKLRAGGLRIIV